MDNLVDTVVVTGEPVVDGRQVPQHATCDTGLLGDLPHRRLLGRLLTLQVALGQAPLQTAATVAARDDGSHGPAVMNVNDQAARTRLVDDRQVACTRPARL